MPTPGGLPKPGEVWEKTTRLPKPKEPRVWETTKIRFVVIKRGTGNYWSLHVMLADGSKQLWVDASYWHSNGELKFIGLAGPKTRAKIGIFS